MLTSKSIRVARLSTFFPRNTRELIIDNITNVPKNSDTNVELLNSQETIAKISFPNTTEFYIRKGSLLSLYCQSGSETNDSKGKYQPFPLDSMTITNETINKWSNLMAYSSLSASSFQKISSTLQLNDSTAHINILLSSNFNSSSNKLPNKSIYPIKLDGTTDWHIFKNDSILAFERSLNLKFNQSILNNFKNITATIKERHLFNKNFQILKGRGSVLLFGQGSIIPIQLKNLSDEVLVDSSNLIAINGTSQLDINNAITS